MKNRQRYQPMPTSTDVTRREFVRIGAATAAAGGIVLGVPSIPGAQDRTPPPAPETNINDFMKTPKGKHALPGAFPGRGVEVKDPRSLVDDKIDAKVVAGMFERGVRTLTGKDMKERFGLFFEPGDVVGIKVNNAIYQLAQALLKVQQYRFPVMATELTRAYLGAVGQAQEGGLGAALRRFAADPSDVAAADALAQAPEFVGTTRTTCVATRLDAGHAENALPQTAKATINCRIFPGVPVETVRGPRGRDWRRGGPG